jgi:hypothetical protein
MGCDFQLLGSQPDKEIQERCVDFLDDFTLAQRKAGHFGVGVSELTGEDGLPEETRVLRSDVLLFKPNEEFVATLREFRGESIWKPDLLYGTVVECGAYHPLHVIFDRSYAGFLCTATMPGEQDDWTGNDAPFDAVTVRPGAITQFHPGTALYFVLAHALRLHFIPNLQIDSETHADTFKELLESSGWMGNLADAELDKLPIMVIDAAWALQKHYDQISRQSAQ